MRCSSARPVGPPGHAPQQGYLGGQPPQQGLEQPLAQQPYAQQPYAQQPYAQQPYGAGPAQAPYGAGPAQEND